MSMAKFQLRWLVFSWGGIPHSTTLQRFVYNLSALFFVFFRVRDNLQSAGPGSDDWTIVRSATQHEMANPAKLGSVADFWAVEEKKLGAVRTLHSAR